MALFTDGAASTIEDLSAQDSQLLTVANTEGIDVSLKLALAQEGLAIELEEFLRDRGFAVDLGAVVVTPPLRLWHTYRTLEAVYRDAYHNQLNDRYAKKGEQFGQLANWARERLRNAGLGIMRAPIPRANAPELRSGSGSLENGTYYVAMAWVDGRDAVGAASIPAEVAVTGGGLVAVPGASPKTAIAWNVYVGASPESVARQNDEPIDFDESWAQTAPLRAGERASEGQRPDFYYPMPRLIERG